MSNQRRMMDPLEIMGHISMITDAYTGGDRPVGPPVYHCDGRSAYSPEQAKIIFENLLDARVKDSPIPFISAEDGACALRRDAIMKHMMFHQKIPADAIGVALGIYQHGPRLRMANFAKRIHRGLKPQSTNHEQHITADFDFHTAPTINVIMHGEITPLVIDPALCDAPVPYTLWKSAQIDNVDILHYDWGSKDKTITSISGELAHDNRFVKMQLKMIHVSTIDELRADMETNGEKRNRFDYRQHYNYTDNEVKWFEDGRDAHEMLQKKAKALGIETLPNCGPRALELVLKARER